MTIRELKKALAHYNDDEHLAVCVFGPDKASAVAEGEITGVQVCPTCDDLNLVVVITEYADRNSEKPETVQPRPMDVTPTL